MHVPLLSEKIIVCFLVVFDCTLRCNNFYSLRRLVSKEKNQNWHYSQWVRQLTESGGGILGWECYCECARASFLFVQNSLSTKMSYPSLLFDYYLSASDVVVTFVQIRIRNLLFSSLTFSAYYFLKEHLHHFSKIKVTRSHKTVGIMVLLTIFAKW